MIPGRGVCAGIQGRSVLAGNPKLLQEHGVKEVSSPEAEAYIRQGCTVTYVAVDSIFAGFLALSDTLRKESTATITAKLHIHEVRSNCLPEDKLKYIEEYQNQDMPVCMIGDGVNDAPALKKADIGIAMGGVGSDIAVDAADIALVDDEVKELPHLIALSKRMMTTIKLNMTFSMTLNFVAIALAIIGTLNPVVGALVHNAGSVLVITNSAFLLKWKKKSYENHRSYHWSSHLWRGDLLSCEREAGSGIQKDLYDYQCDRSGHHGSMCCTADMRLKLP